MKINISIFFVVIFVFSSCKNNSKYEQEYYNIAHENGILANEGYNRSLRYVTDWLKEADSISGLIPENLYKGRDIWNSHNSAADNYPFMVLTSYILDDSLYYGKMLEILNTEKRITSKLGTLPSPYSFSKQDFVNEKIDTAKIIFGASEYIKDGLLPITEYIGESPWSKRMIEMLNDLSKYITVSENLSGEYFGNSVDTEVNGELLQVLSRLYWMTKNDMYLTWAIDIGDYYLIKHPEILNKATRLRLRDHGCEIIGGLSELYVTLHFVDNEKKDSYKANLYKVLNRILEIGINQDGMFYNEVNMSSGIIVDSTIVDNWGYLYNAYYAVYLIDNIITYRDAVLQALNSLSSKYSNFNWENGSSDGFADAIESGICFYNREPIPDLKTWIDKEIQFMWAIQDNKIKNSGIIEGWHGDGNFARTSLLYCLWKTNGVFLKPWREDLIMGTYKKDSSLFISISAKEDWNGILYFDFNRHQELMNLPLDYTRINHFPEWYTLNDKDMYTVAIDNKTSTSSGRKLKNGIEISYKKNNTYQIKVINRTLSGL